MRRAWPLLIVLGIAACGRGSALQDLPYAPGSTVVGQTAFVGEMFGLPRSAWEQVELRTERPFEQVRDFYAGVTISGWAPMFENETPRPGGKVYTRFLADGQRRRFYVISVEERLVAKDVSVLLRRGVSKPR